MPLTTTSNILINSGGFGFFTFLPNAIALMGIPYYYVVAIRETSMTLDNILTNGILALASAVGLCIAMNNLAKTTLQQLYAKHINKIKGHSKKNSSQAEESKQVELEIVVAAKRYSLFMNSFLFLFAFTLIAASLLSILPTFFNFMISSLVPAISLAYLTSPRS